MGFFENNKQVFVLGGSVLALTAGVMLYLSNSKQKEQIKKEYEREVLQSQEEEQRELKQVEEQREEKVKRNANKRRLSEEIQNELNNKNNEQINNVNEELQQIQQEQQLQQQQYDQELSSKISRASNKVKVEYLNGSSTFNFDTITSILEASLDFIGQEYITYTQKNRAERRRIRTSDSERYKELVLEYNAQIEKFILTAQDELLDSMNIQKEQFEDSINSLLANGYYQQLYMVQSVMRQKISEKLPRTKNVTKETYKEIIQYQLDSLINQKDFFITVISQLQFVPDISELIPFVMNTMIQDIIYEKFAVEEEDQTSQMSAQDVIEDPEMHSLLKQIEEAMLNMMSSLGLNYIDEEQELEEIERLREQGQYSEY